MSKTLLVSILLVIIILAPTALSASKPNWVSVGKYAEYELILERSDGSRASGYARFEIIEVYDDHAVMKASYENPIDGSTWSREDTWYYDKSYYDVIINPNELRARNYPIEDKTVPAGTFKCYKVERGSLTIWYEVSTGLTVYGVDKASYGRMIIQLKSTNIIGGFPWLWIMIAVTIVVVVVAVVLVIVLKARKAATTAPTQPPAPETLNAPPPPPSS